jgi:hypothetical protein
MLEEKPLSSFDEVLESCAKVLLQAGVREDALASFYMSIASSFADVAYEVEDGVLKNAIEG